MTFARLVLYFFISFFGLQLVFGEAGLISFFQIKKTTETLYNNIDDLQKIHGYLANQVILNKENQSYLLMNAHRVGLLGENEYLIKLNTQVFFKSLIYSPGTIVINKKQFYFNNVFLFFFALIFTTLVLSIKIIQFILQISTKNSKKNGYYVENSGNIENTDYKNVENIRAL